jgi:hypothetical protein
MAKYQIVLEVILPPETLQVSNKVGKMGVHGQLMYLLVFPCFEVNEPYILIELIDLSVLGVMNASIDIHEMSLLTQFVSKLPDIDAHTTGVFCP